MRYLPLQKLGLLRFMLLVLNMEFDGSVLHFFSLFSWYCLLFSVVICRRGKAETKQLEEGFVDLTFMWHCGRGTSTVVQVKLILYWAVIDDCIHNLLSSCTSSQNSVASSNTNLLRFTDQQTSWKLAKCGWDPLEVSASGRSSWDTATSHCRSINHLEQC